MPSHPTVTLRPLAVGLFIETDEGILEQITTEVEIGRENEKGFIECGSGTFYPKDRFAEVSRSWDN